MPGLYWDLQLVALLGEGVMFTLDGECFDYINYHCSLLGYSLDTTLWG